VIGGVLVGAVGWRWVFFLNVPVGLLAVVAGWYLLPRTRRAADGAAVGRSADRLPGGDAAGADLGGMALLAASSSAGMLAISSLSGLGLPAWAVAAFAACALLAGAALVRRERRIAAPLLDLRALAASGVGPAVGGALCSYLVLFGPLVLFPQVVAARGGSAAAAGLLLTALPVGFGLAAALGDRLLPPWWANGRRCALGGALAAGAAAALAVPAPDPVTMPLLGLLGIGLGLYTPANNAEIMAALPAGDAAAAGGMVNMTRGIGTALGVAVVALGLHAGAHLEWHGVGQTLSMTALAAAALIAVGCGLRGVRAAPGAAR
jgi:MFS family permease